MKDISGKRGTSKSVLVIVTTPKEVIGFRFMLIACGAGLLALLIAGVSYIIAETKQNKLSAIGAVNEACLTKVMPTIPDCNVPYTESDGSCMDLASARCPYGPQITELSTDQNDWAERAVESLYTALLLLILPALLFYGIRWGFTGRVKPLWPLNR